LITFSVELGIRWTLDLYFCGAIFFYQMYGGMGLSQDYMDDYMDTPPGGEMLSQDFMRSMDPSFDPPLDSGRSGKH